MPMQPIANGLASRFLARVDRRQPSTPNGRGRETPAGHATETRRRIWLAGTRSMDSRTLAYGLVPQDSGWRWSVLDCRGHTIATGVEAAKPAAIAAIEAWLGTLGRVASPPARPGGG